MRGTISGSLGCECGDISPLHVNIHKNMHSLISGIL